MNEAAKSDIEAWIVRSALAGSDERATLTGVVKRLTAAGVSLWRVSLASNLLDPTLGGRGVRWKRGEGAVEESFLRSDDDTNADWLSSPWYVLYEGGETMLRRRLDASYRRGEFPLLDAFVDQGMTDYVAFSVRAGEGLRLGEVEGSMVSWTTDAPEGFTATQIDLLAGIMPTLTLALMLHSTGRSARALLATYLGSDAAERVIAGNVVRGRAESIRAVVWFSDLVSYTRISDSLDPSELLALLNEYAEVQVESIEEQGGHVLKFIGDGLLAIFPDADMGAAALRALDAAGRLRSRIAALNARRAAAGLPVTDTHVALHVGELLYGNVGSPRRLDFTVLGPAVNEAARIEALCASLDQHVIVSTALAEALGPARSRLVSLGRYALKGVARPQELYTLDPIPESGAAG